MTFGNDKTRNGKTGNGRPEMTKLEIAFGNDKTANGIWK